LEISHTAIPGFSWQEQAKNLLSRLKATLLTKGASTYKKIESDLMRRGAITKTPSRRNESGEVDAL
jgi:hypothetical protein